MPCRCWHGLSIRRISAAQRSLEPETEREHIVQTTNRLPQLDPAQATGRTKQLFDGAQAKLGIAPDIFRVFGNSPGALEGCRNFSGALAGGVLNAKVREQIALLNLATYLNTSRARWWISPR